MANKDQNIMLLQEVVGQLRKLNASSVRDRLREAEEAKRAEQIALQGETEAVQQETIVSSSEDFRRRFIAGQAKTFTDSKLTKTEGGRRDIRRNSLLASIDKNVMEGFYYNTEAIGTIGTNIENAGGIPQTPAAQAAAAMESPFIGLIKVNTDNLVQNLANIKNINFQILEFLKTTRQEDDLRFNTQQREAEERRKEAIKLNQKPMAGTGQAGELDLNDKGGGGGGTGLFTGLGIIALKSWKWVKLKAAAFLAYGKKLFSKFKNMSPKLKKHLGNPRKWPFILAAVLAGSFLSKMGFAGEPGEDDSDDSLLPPDLEDLPEESALASNMDTLFTVAMTGGILSKSKLIQNVAKSVGNKVRANFKAAKPGTMKGRLYKNPTFQRGLRLGGRGLLRFMGPWGFGAWVAWEIGSMIMKSYETNLEAAEEARVAVIDEYTSQSVNLLDDEYDSLANIVAPDNRISGKFDSEERKKEAIRSIKNLMKGKSQQEKDELIEQLKFLGWNENELRSALNTPNGNNNSNLQSKLEMQEKNRFGDFSEYGKASGVINSGNSYVGDQITQNSIYVQGSAGGGTFPGGREIPWHLRGGYN